MGNFVDNPVNRRFKKVYEQLEKLKLIKGKSDLAKHLGTYNHVINSILKGERNITVDQLHKMFQTYGVNGNYLFELSDDVFLAGHPATSDIPSIPKSAGHFTGRQNITLVPHRATAGYALSSQENDFSEYPKFSIPGYEGEDLYAFEIEGDSMLPTITNGDIVVAEKMRPDERIRDNQVYIVVTDSVVAKRIQLVKENGQVVSMRLISDNDAVYKPYEVEPSEVREILKVKVRLTNHAIA